MNTSAGNLEGDLGQAVGSKSGKKGKKPFRNGKKVAAAVKKGVGAHESGMHKGKPKTPLSRKLAGIGI